MKSKLSIKGLRKIEDENRKLREEIRIQRQLQEEQKQHQRRAAAANIRERGSMR